MEKARAPHQGLIPICSLNRCLFASLNFHIQLLTSRKKQCLFSHLDKPAREFLSNEKFIGQQKTVFFHIIQRKNDKCKPKTPNIRTLSHR